MPPNLNILDSVERAIDSVTRCEFNVLTANRTQSETLLSIDAGLRIFDDLYRGRKPDYHNPFTAISYANWYHLGKSCWRIWRLRS